MSTDQNLIYVLTHRWQQSAVPTDIQVRLLIRLMAPVTKRPLCQPSVRVIAHFHAWWWMKFMATSQKS